MLESQVEQLVGCVICELKRERCHRVEFLTLGPLLTLEVYEADGILDEGVLDSVHLLECEVAQCVSTIFVLNDV